MEDARAECNPIRSHHQTTMKVKARRRSTRRSTVKHSVTTEAAEATRLPFQIQSGQQCCQFARSPIYKREKDRLSQEGFPSRALLLISFASLSRKYPREPGSLFFLFRLSLSFVLALSFRLEHPVPSVCQSPRNTDQQIN